MKTNGVNPTQDDFADCSGLKDSDYQFLRKNLKNSVSKYMSKFTATILLAVTGLMLTPFTHAAVSFTNNEGDVFRTEYSRLADASYAGGSDGCSLCLRTIVNWWIQENTVTYQDAENVHYAPYVSGNYSISVKFFIPLDGNFVRKLVSITNNYSSNWTPYSYDLHTLNSNENVVDTSSGDTIANTSDSWLIHKGSGTQPYYVSHWGHNLHYLNQNWGNGFYARYRETYPANDTRYMITYAAVDDTLTAARNIAQELESGTAFRQYDGLSIDELEKGMNYDPVVSVSLKGSDLIAEQGDTAVHTLTVNNNTVGDINFNISINNSPSWNTVHAVSTIFVEAGGSETFNVSVDVPVYANLFNSVDSAQIQVSGGGIVRSASVTTRTITAQLTDMPSGSSEFRSALSADGEVIAFHSNKDVTGNGSNLDGSYEVFRIDSDGTNLIQLTDSLDDAFLDGVNGDASKIVYSEDMGFGLSGLYVMDGSGNNVVYLQDTASFLGDHSSEITADGHQVVFSGIDTDDSSFDFFKINSDGTGLMQLTDTDVGEFIGSPSISSMGDVIAFNTTDNLGGLNTSNNLAVFSIDSNGESLKLHSRTSSTSGLPSVSGNGQYISFSSNADGLFDDNDDESFEIYRVSVDGNERVQLTATDRDSINSSLSYDGSRVLISSNGDVLGNGSNIDGTEEIFIINIDGNGADSGTHLQLTQSNRDSTTFTSNISADGERVAFTSYGNLAGENPDFGQEIFISFLDGRIFDNTIFTGGIQSLVEFGFPDDVVQAAIDDMYNGVDDDEEEKIFLTTEDGGGLLLDNWLLMLLSSLWLVNRKMKKRSSN